MAQTTAMLTTTTAAMTITIPTMAAFTLLSSTLLCGPCVVLVETPRASTHSWFCHPSGSTVHMDAYHMSPTGVPTQEYQSIAGTGRPPMLLSMSLYLCISLYLSISLYIYLYIYLFLYLYLYLSLSIYIYIFLYLYLYLYRERWR